MPSNIDLLVVLITKWSCIYIEVKGNIHLNTFSNTVILGGALTPTIYYTYSYIIRYCLKEDKKY